jgi:transcriptional regulator GlxA family with amidase domain
LTLVVSAGQPVILLHPSAAVGRHASLIGGLRTQPVLIGQAGRQAGVQVMLTPLGARAILGVPAAELAHRELALPDVLAGTAAELVDRVRAAPDLASRTAVVERVLLRLLRREVAVQPQVARAWHAMAVTGGRRPVGQLAGEVGWSSRHLGERFRAETGLTPKQAARVFRFHRARQVLTWRIGAGRPADLSGLAVACGFADQAHLSREWRALTGLSPTRWMRAELRFVQDSSAGAVAPSEP